MPGLVVLRVLFFCLPALAQTSGKLDSSGQDFSKEGAIIEQMTTKVTFQSDGNYTREQRSRVRMQSDAGVQQYGILRYAYQASVEHVEILDVRVTTSNGSVLESSLDSTQDVTSDIYRQAPMYSDLREKHVPVKGLEPGYTLEYAVRWQSDHPLAKGQFWMGYQFVKNLVILDEQLEISVPRERAVQLKSQTIQPTTHDEKGRRIYKWNTSNLESQSIEKQKENQQSYDAYRGALPPPDVLISSFHTWEEVGRWYETLQQEKLIPSLGIKAKAEELTKGLSDDNAKIRAIYNYVSLRYRYIAIGFGVGRYQPHAAAEILDNQYGDCKDKETLLEALLSVVGIRSYPALINSRMTVDPDVPSPGQFDHVISVVPRGTTLLWMDATPEVTPMGHLVYPLRGKPALVIIPDKVAFQTTPANPLVATRFDVTVTAKLESDDTLHAHAVVTSRGDYELYDRYRFRRVPESQWADLEKSGSYAAEHGGTISNVRASSPEKTDEPFTQTYDYTLKDFAEGDRRRFIIPTTIDLPTVKDEDSNRTTPLWLGSIGESQYEIRIELPKGSSAIQLPSMDLKESFAEFHENSEVIDGVLIARRRLLLKADAITPDQLMSYKNFQKSVRDRCATYIYLNASTDAISVRPASTPALAFARMGELLRQGIVMLPGSSNAEALHQEQDARRSLENNDHNAAIASLKQAVSLDSTFSRAWIELGTAYFGAREAQLALNAFQKAVDASCPPPLSCTNGTSKQTVPYEILAFVYMGLGKRDEAIATWQTLQGIAPANRDLLANLSWLYMTQKRYAEAAKLLESEVKANPSDETSQMYLGIVRLRSGQTDEGFAVLSKALETDSSPEMLNNVAYELAENDTHLSDALSLSQRSVKEIEGRSQKINLEKIENADRLLPMTISAYWDTLGWIYFKMGDLAEAESFINSAWRLGQDGVVADHLGQVYEREHKQSAALHMYNLALEANPRLEETPARMRNLAHVPLPKNRMSAGEELGLMRTVKLPTIVKETATADFNVLIVGGKIDKVAFVSGSESLRNAAGNLESSPFEEPLPANSTVHLLRRGAVSCSSYTGCSFVFYPLSAAAGEN